MRAANCRELAAAAASDAARETFLNLARTWEALARELESSQVFLLVMDAIEPKKAIDPLYLDGREA
jgi:hypothetical protein